MKQILRFTT